MPDIETTQDTPVNIAVVQITPTNILGKTATQVVFNPALVIFSTSATSQYVISDADGATVTSGNVSTTPEQYAQWGTSDVYIIDCFLSNLGLTRLS